MPLIEIHQRRNDVKAELQVAECLKQAFFRDDEPVFVRTERGRPMLVDAWNEVDCNWSHSGKLLAIVHSQHHRVGIDIELFTERDYRALAKRFLMEGEVEAIEDAFDFMQLWVRKEALLKGIGQGLAHGLKRVRFRKIDSQWVLDFMEPSLGSQGDWAVQGIEMEPGYVGAVAWRPK